MLTVRNLLDAGTTQLASVAKRDAKHEALLLLAYATGRQSASLRLNPDDIITDTHGKIFTQAVQKRTKFQPIAQIIGQRAFWKNDFIVTPDVLDPRPDTETLIEQAVLLGGINTILDLGTGSGCILLSLLGEFPSATGVGVDASQPALDVGQRNAAALGYDRRASFMCGNWSSGITQTFDLLVSNPPYISADAMKGLSRDVLDWEPRMALTPEGDGLGAYHTIISDAPRVLNDGGCILLEIGYDQGAAVCELLALAGFSDVKIIKDINGKDRIASAKLV